MPAQGRLTKVTCVETTIDSEFPLTCQVEIDDLDTGGTLTTTVNADAGTQFSDEMDTWASDNDFDLV